QIGVGAAGIVSAVLIGVGALALLVQDLAGADLPSPPLRAVLVVSLIALVIGRVVGGVLETARGRREAEPVPEARGAGACAGRALALSRCARGPRRRAGLSRAGRARTRAGRAGPVPRAEAVPPPRAAAGPSARSGR